MTRTLIAVVTAIVLAGPALAATTSTPSERRPLPSSYAPRPEAKRHEYGAPLGPTPVGLAQVARPAPTPSGNIETKARVAQRAPARDSKKVTPRKTSVTLPNPR